MSDINLESRCHDQKFLIGISNLFCQLAPIIVGISEKKKSLYPISMEKAKDKKD